MGLGPRELLNNSSVDRSVCTLLLPLGRSLALSLFHSSSPWTPDSDGTFKRHSDAQVKFQHSTLSIQSSFGICAYLYNYYGPFTVIGPNKSRLPNVGSLIGFIVDHVGRLEPCADRSCEPCQYSIAKIRVYQCDSTDKRKMFTLLFRYTIFYFIYQPFPKDLFSMVADWNS